MTGVDGDLAAAGIAIGTGLVVVLIVEAAVALRMWARHKRSTARITSFLLDFEERMAGAMGSDDGALTKEMVQFAFWNEHVDSARLTIAAHSPYLKQEHFLELMSVIDGWARVSRMIGDGRIPGSKMYDQYFSALRALNWLKL